MGHSKEPNVVADTRDLALGWHRPRVEMFMYPALLPIAHNQIPSCDPQHGYCHRSSLQGFIPSSFPYRITKSVRVVYGALTKFAAMAHSASPSITEFPTVGHSAKGSKKSNISANSNLYYNHLRSCIGFPIYIKKLLTRNIVTDVTDGYYVVITVVTT